MKKWTILSLIALLLGAIMVTGAFAMVDFQWERLGASMNRVEKTYEAAADSLSSIVIENASDDIVVRRVFRLHRDLRLNLLVARIEISGARRQVVDLVLHHLATETGGGTAYPGPRKSRRAGAGLRAWSKRKQRPTFPSAALLSYPNKYGAFVARHH